MIWFWRLVLTRDWLPAEMRVRAANKLGEAKNPSAIRSLMRVRHAGNTPVAEAAVAAMKQIGIAAVEPLLKQLTQTLPAGRANAAEALGWLGKDARPAVSALMAKLSDPQTAVRIRACEALGRIGPGAVEAVPDFMNWLKDREPRLVETAARALGGIGPLAKDALPDRKSVV